VNHFLYANIDSEPATSVFVMVTLGESN
jgi:hypothetical protein